MATVAALSPRASRAPEHPNAIFVLRNNDIGDLLIVTPLFEALRRRFPGTRIIAGVGDWNRPVLAHNPHVDEVVAVNAPWHNAFVPRQSPMAALRYLCTSPEIATLTAAAPEVGIDVLGSPWGALLLMRAGIVWRLGVRGYAGGHSGSQQFVDFDDQMHVGRAALRFAELLGTTDLPLNRPQVFLTAAEHDWAEQCWRMSPRTSGRRIVVGPGGGYEAKRWPAGHFAKLAGALARDPANQIIVLGSKAEARLGDLVAGSGPDVINLTGRTDLRQAFALVARADLIICNSSMLMHAAAAFGTQTFVFLGEMFPSASAHQRLWGYPGVTRVCGKDADRPNIWAPEEAVAVVAAASEALSAAVHR